jgi:hypothetical protein
MPRLSRYVRVLRGVVYGALVAMPILAIAVPLLVFATTGNASQASIDGIATLLCLSIAFLIAYVLEGIAQEQATK